MLDIERKKGVFNDLEKTQTFIPVDLSYSV